MLPVSRFVNPLAPRHSSVLAKSTEVKAWVRDLLDLPEETPVSVIELACRDQNCPDIETVVGVMDPGKPIRTVRIHLPLAEITQHAVRVAVRDADGN